MTSPLSPSAQPSRSSPPIRKLRERPDLDQLRRQAKELLEAFKRGGGDAVREVNAHYHGADPAKFALHDAQLALARSYGFDSWPKLKAYVDGVTTGRLCEAVERGDVQAARDMLRRRPEIVNLEWPGHGETRALHVAVLHRDAALVRLLMEHGADARVGIYPNRDATAAWTLASERGYDDITAIIEEEERRRAARLAGQASLADSTDGLLNDLEEALSQGDEAGDGGAVRRLEANPELVLACDPKGWTALDYAAGMLRERAVEWLLAHGADPNHRTEDGWTALELAASGRLWQESAGARQRFAAVAKGLRQAGADLGGVAAVALGEADWVRSRHAAGSLPGAASLEIFGPYAGLLSAAVRHDRPEMLALLLDLGYDPDERARVEGIEEVVTSQGMPLYGCARWGKLEMARLLLERGADPNAAVYASGSPLFAAYRAHDAAMIALLEQYGGALDASSVGYVRQTELARRMLAGEADPRLAEGAFSGKTVAEQLLWSGASGGDAEIVRMSLERIDWPRDDPRWFRMLWRPLPGHWTRPEPERRLFLECFRRVLERSDPNLRDERFGQTMLHEVVARDHGEGVAFATLLLDAGARMDQRDHLLKSTPLGWACRWGRVELVRLFMARGADVAEADAAPWATPRAWAKKMGHEAVVKALEQAGV